MYVLNIFEAFRKVKKIFQFILSFCLKQKISKATFV